MSSAYESIGQPQREGHDFNSAATGFRWAVTSNLYLRVMQHKEGTLEGFTAACGGKRLLYFEGYEDILHSHRWRKTTQRLATRKEAQLIATINPEWVPQQDPVLGRRRSKSSEQHGQDKHPRGPSTPRHQALCHAINL